MGRKQDSFRQNLGSFISIILTSMVIFAEQFLSALVGGSSNGGLTFAALPDADTEMWAGDLFLTVLSFGVAGLPAQGRAPVAGCSAEHPAQSGGGSRNVRLAERNGTGKRCISAPCDQGWGYSESGFSRLVSWDDP